VNDLNVVDQRELLGLPAERARQLIGHGSFLSAPSVQRETQQPVIKVHATRADSASKIRPLGR
jgi:hypothetical protein